MNNAIVKIGWLFPDSLYLHGDRGNILAVERMAQAAGFEAVVEKIDFETEEFTPMDYDFLFCSPGEIAVFSSIIDWLKPYTLSLKAYIQAGRPLLVTGTSVALWGNEIRRCDKTVVKGLEIVDISAEENPAVYGDDLYFKCVYDDKAMEIIGNQIQMIDITLGNEAPFGELLYGYGNTGKTTQEGVQIKNAIFTNTLGPLLVLTPWLTEAIVRVIAKNQGIDLAHFSADIELETQSFASKKQFIMTKKTGLTNCPRSMD